VLRLLFETNQEKEMDIRENCVICRRPIVEDKPVHEAPESGPVCFDCFMGLVYSKFPGERARGREK